MKIRVIINDAIHLIFIANYVVDYDDPAEKRILAQQIDNAVRAGQIVHTFKEQSS